MKRYLVAAVVAATLAGGAFAFAAGFGVNPAPLGSGSAGVTSCQTATINVAYVQSDAVTTSVDYHKKTLYYAEASYPNGGDGFYVDNLHLTNIDSGCFTKSLIVQLSKSDGTAIQQFTVNLPSTSTADISLASGNGNGATAQAASTLGEVHLLLNA